jgi:UDP-3-O-[3-hydroxymyristoyl] glucosamine N-acyltransferase
VIESDQRQGPTGGEGARSLTADAIAHLVRGTLHGDGSVVVKAVAPLERAGPGDLSFLASAKYADVFGTTRAGVILVAPALGELASPTGTRIVVDRPHDALMSVIPHLYASTLPPASGIHHTAVIGRGARLGRDVTLGAHVVLGAGAVVGDGVIIEAGSVVGEGVVIGAGCVLWPGVVLYRGTELGERVLIHAGARIGSDGFGYVYRDAAHHKIPHVGRCRIESDVEIGANTTIDRGSIDDTVIGAGTKIDNLVHIGHNVRIGRACLVMAQVGISGSARIGDGCIIAGQAGLQGHITVGSRARIGGQAGVLGDVPAGETWTGYPARPHRESLRAYAALFKLSGLMKRLERLLDGQS